MIINTMDYQSNEQVGRLLKRRREATGLTQRQFVELYNASKPHGVTLCAENVTKYERGQYNMKFIQIMKWLNLTSRLLTKS